MTTLKQLEALAAIAETGSMDAAARRLGVVHSAVSKQIKDFEDSFGYPLLDRSGRAVRLTVEGVEVLNRAKAVLSQRDLLLERFASKEVLSRKLRLGVTELTALTWLPRLLQAIQAEYPRVAIEPEVDLSVNLRQRLQAGQLDLAILPDAFAATGYVKDKLAEVHNDWVCAPGLMQGTSRIPVAKLGEYTLLTQGSLSGSGILIGEWLRRHGVVPKSTIPSNSIVALVGIAASGLGVAYLPQSVIRNFLEAGHLVQLNVTPRLPKIHYVTMIRSDLAMPFLRSVVELAKRTCDFEHAYPTGTAEHNNRTGA
ncbi:LysR family transcriptional regulator [Cupriavidus basilensis]|uniref:LysR family transcriptional regulator n=1 Tax=Cupriavidus basilensis TaxID=68895 RepID=A0ABT6AQC8_9BURK|nr:LysR family transcriptional regulator [Cupriavidus basilensis]MDF3834797.1 LysR family transcriptional regulator [Cupriavidus basilensis]